MRFFFTLSGKTLLPGIRSLRVFVCNMRSISFSNLVDFFEQVRLILATALKWHDSCGIRFVLPALFSEISEFIPGP